MKPVRWNATVLAVSILSILIVGIALGTRRVDVLMVALRLVLWAVVTRRRVTEREVTVSAVVDDAVPGQPVLVVRAQTGADMVEFDIQSAGQRFPVVTAPGAAVRFTRPIFHSGPVELAMISGRALHSDATEFTLRDGPYVMNWSVQPALVSIDTLPVRWRLTELHGAHPGLKQGDGGDFRELRAFQPGDELRRVDWRATARAARRPGELMVRRTNTLSEANIVIVVDNVQDLGTVVRAWGSTDEEATGVTSLDYAREAALALATAGSTTGDRIAYLELAAGGRFVPGGAGRRHREKIAIAIGGTGSRPSTIPTRRTPQIPAGAVVYVLAAFVGTGVAELALRWQASGHRVIAIDVLPGLDTAKLSVNQRIALDIVRTERAVSFRALAGAGVDLVTWPDPAQRARALALASRLRRL